MTARADLPRLNDLPIPDDVRAAPHWPEQMREMADWIGPLDTLRVSEAFGGEVVYISHNPQRSPFRDLLSPAQVETMARVYGGSRLTVSNALPLLRRVRRAGVIAATRAGRLTIMDAARICGTSRTYMSHLVNQTSEGAGAPALAVVPRRVAHDPRQIDMFETPAD